MWSCQSLCLWGQYESDLLNDSAGNCLIKKSMHYNKHRYLAIWNPLASSAPRMGRMQMTEMGLQTQGTNQILLLWNWELGEDIYHTCFVIAIMFRML